MKTLWKKMPAWVKAILLNIVLLYPIIIAIQGLIGINAQYGNEWPWSVPLVSLFLYFFYKLNKRYTQFDKESDVRLSFCFDYKSPLNWSFILAIILILPSIITLFSYAFDIQSTEQLVYIQSFTALKATTAVPMLIVLAFSAGLIEEIVYRAHIQNVLVRSYGRWIGFALTGLIFAALHFLPLPLLIPYLLVSVLFSYVADHLRSTGVVIMAHFLVDMISFLLLYFSPDVLREANTLNTLVLLFMLVTGSIVLFRGVLSTKKFVNHKVAKVQ
ncbi:CPBP family intramembrane glutamic endopeptidase [Robertkochia flava]|uniref:CPBP family intramembrane glutamic endopeptidase n=1 Tax=Robertkochia flava TaxID=3447986 RepID=UPI001CC92BE7|nr:type II CAAX endopeptidase family protein [Robertkochia marina]